MDNVKNTRILTKEELEYLVEKYKFRMLNDTTIGVKTTTCVRENTHSALERFTINTPIKRITITPAAITYWKQLKKKPHLIAVQNALNILSITYQEISVEEIANQIEKNSTKILEK